MLIEGKFAGMHTPAGHVALSATVYVTAGSSPVMFFCKLSTTA